MDATDRKILALLQQDILDLLLLNARVPEERRGDYFAQVAACRLGVRRVSEMISSRGVPLLVAAFDEIIRRTREFVGKNPQGGTAISIWAATSCCASSPTSRGRN